MRGLACALACVAASYAQTPVDMIGYWRFDDGSGNIASDSATAAKQSGSAAAARRTSPVARHSKLTPLPPVARSR